MRLYYVPKTRASRPRWLLEELGKPFELTRLTPPDTKTPEHTARHPLQHVPVLETPEGPVYESAAICLYLADLYPDRRLIPPPGTRARGLVYQWSFFAMTELEPIVMKLSASRRAGEHESPEGRRLIDSERERLLPAMKSIENAVTHGHLVGDFSVADVVLGSVLLWAKGYKVVPDALEPYLGRLTSRDAFKRAMKD